MKRTLVCVVLALVAASGCGSSASVTATTATAATPSDTAVAQAALLQLPDFPAGWSAGPKGPDAIHCPAVDAARRNPSAESGRFTQPRVHAASQQVVVFPDAAAARAALRAVGARSTFECIAAATEAATRAGVRPGIQVGPMTAAALRLPRLGDGTEAAQLTLVASGGGVRQQVYEDVVFTRVGRGVSMLALLSQGGHDDALLAALSARAAERLRDALATAR